MVVDSAPLIRDASAGPVVKFSRALELKSATSCDQVGRQEELGRGARIAAVLAQRSGEPDSYAEA